MNRTYGRPGPDESDHGPGSRPRTDGPLDPWANASVIASVGNWTSHREWNKYDSQQSATRNLTAGNWKYITVLHKEGGGDKVSVGWRKPSDGSGSESAEVVPAEQLSPY